MKAKNLSDKLNSRSLDVDSYIGKVYTRMTVTKFLRFKVYKNSRAPIFECKCMCGTIKEVSLWDLRKGSTKSCGCYKKDVKSLPEGQAGLNATFDKYKRAAEKRGYEFNLNINEFENIVAKPCFYCGEPPNNKYYNANDTGDFIYSGIDRKDNKNGYNTNNCLPCCKVCNRAKSNMKYQDFINWIKTLVKFNK